MYSRFPVRDQEVSFRPDHFNSRSHMEFRCNFLLLFIIQNLSRLVH
jgi:hypothetical protein